MMALGRTIFYRKVKGVTGYAPKEYLRVMRMKKAAELLLKTDATVAEVAYQVGINASRRNSGCLLQLIKRTKTVYHKLDNGCFVTFRLLLHGYLENSNIPVASPFWKWML